MLSLPGEMRKSCLILLIFATCFGDAVNADDPESARRIDMLNNLRRKNQSLVHQYKMGEMQHKISASEVRHAGYERLVLIQRHIVNRIAATVADDAKTPKLPQMLECRHTGDLAVSSSGSGQSNAGSPVSSLDLTWDLIYGDSIFATITSWPSDMGEVHNMGRVECAGSIYSIKVSYVASEGKARTVVDPLPELNGKSLHFAFRDLPQPPEMPVPSEQRKLTVKERLQKRELRMLGYHRLVLFHRALHHAMPGRQLHATADTELRMSHHGELARECDLRDPEKIPSGSPLAGVLEWQLRIGKSHLATIAISPIKTEDCLESVQIDGLDVFVSVPFVSETRTGTDKLKELGGESIQSLILSRLNEEQ